MDESPAKCFPRGPQENKMLYRTRKKRKSLKFQCLGVEQKEGRGHISLWVMDEEASRCTLSAPTKIKENQEERKRTRWDRASEF